MNSSVRTIIVLALVTTGSACRSSAPTDFGPSLVSLPAESNELRLDTLLCPWESIPPRVRERAEISPDSTACIAGKTTDVYGNPVSAIVTLESVGGRYPETAIVGDRFGLFAFYPVKIGQPVRLRIEAPGYATEVIQGFVPKALGRYAFCLKLRDDPSTLGPV